MPSPGAPRHDAAGGSDALALEELLDLAHIGLADLLVPAVGLQPHFVELDGRMHDIEAFLHELWVGRHALHVVYGDVDGAVEVLIVLPSGQKRLGRRRQTRCPRLPMRSFPIALS